MLLFEQSLFLDIKSELGFYIRTDAKGRSCFQIYGFHFALFNQQLIMLQSADLEEEIFFKVLIWL